MRHQHDSLWIPFRSRERPRLRRLRWSLDQPRHGEGFRPGDKAQQQLHGSILIGIYPAGLSHITELVKALSPWQGVLACGTRAEFTYSQGAAYDAVTVNEGMTHES
jgi:hypothetical protein